MAATAGFKQECPSCGAVVPIKDPKLVGKKTDCPICKFRFVVEAPPAEDGAEAEADTAPAQKAKPKGEQTITAKPGQRCRPIAQDQVGRRSCKTAPGRGR